MDADRQLVVEPYLEQGQAGRQHDGAGGDQRSAMGRRAQQLEHRLNASGSGRNHYRRRTSMRPSRTRASHAGPI